MARTPASATDLTMDQPVMFAPKVKQNIPTVVGQTIDPTVTGQAAVGSHNVFRPDVYRVSEGNLS